MGCGDSRIDTEYYSDLDKADFYRIGLSDGDIHKYLTIFKKYDTASSMRFNLAVFLQDGHLEFNYLLFKIFDLLESHFNNTLTFRQVSLL